MSTYRWKTREVLFVISPNSGEPSTLVRVTMRQGQLRDVLDHGSYGGHLFDAISEATICPALKIDPTECIISVIPESAREYGCPKNEYLHSFDITEGGLEGMLYLH